MPEEGKQEAGMRHGGHFLIPAGALIGLGPAHPWAAIFAIFFIILGFGFIARELVRRG
jgi:hypothetical protein